MIIFTYIRIFIYIFFFLSGHYLPLLLLLYVSVLFFLSILYTYVYIIYLHYIYIYLTDYIHTIMSLWYVTVYFIPTWSVSVCLNWSMVVVSHDCRSCRVVMLAIYDYVDLSFVHWSDDINRQSRVSSKNTGERMAMLCPLKLVWLIRSRQIIPNLIQIIIDLIWTIYFAARGSSKSR